MANILKIIKLPTFFSKVCLIYCLTKKQAWQVMRSMEEMGMVDIVPYQGVRVRSQLPGQELQDC